ncbi:hypothetical protein ACYX34_05995 [Nitrospira sp. CMX1]
MRECHNRLAWTWFLVLSAGFLGGCGERENILVVEQPTEVHAITQAASTPDPNVNIEPGKVIATLKAGETANVVAVYHGQAYDGFKVKLADGTEGIIIAGDTFTVTSR